MKDEDARCGPYVPPSKNLQAETNMGYRNNRVDWFSIGGLEMVTALSLVFMFISFLI